MSKFFHVMLFIFVLMTFLDEVSFAQKDTKKKSLPKKTAQKASVKVLPGDGQANFIWAPVSGAKSYNLYMATQSGVTKNNFSSLPGGKKYSGVFPPVTIMLQNDITYYFQVTAIEGGREIPLSGEINAVPGRNIEGKKKAIGIAAGYEHTCALLSDGYIKCWGKSYEPTPKYISGVANARIIASAKSETCVIISNGMVKCWDADSAGYGTSSYYHPTLPSALQQARMVKIANISPAEKLFYGTMGISKFPASIRGINNAKSIAGGDYHFCALLSDGRVKCWGANNAGQLGNGTVKGSIIPVLVTGIKSAISIAAGADHTCAVLSNGSVKCWGKNDVGQLGNGSSKGPARCTYFGQFSCSTFPVLVSGIYNGKRVAAGLGHSCVVLNSGEVKCWGASFYGQLGNGSYDGPESCSASWGGSVGCSSIPLSVSGINSADKLGLGTYHSCAVLSDGTIKCWGNASFVNAFGDIPFERCGSNGACTTVPVTISNVNNAVGVTAGRSHTCAVLSDGGVMCWRTLGRAETQDDPVNISDNL